MVNRQQPALPNHLSFLETCLNDTMCIATHPLERRQSHETIWIPVRVGKTTRSIQFNEMKHLARDRQVRRDPLHRSVDELRAACYFVIAVKPNAVEVVEELADISNVISGPIPERAVVVLSCAYFATIWFVAVGTEAEVNHDPIFLLQVNLDHA